MPLMDKRADSRTRTACRSTPAWSRLLAGAVRASLLAWGLGWARTYILALVSERIGADLRTTTYEHLLQAVARILRRQADRRPDGAHRLRNRPHQPLPLAAPARFRDRRADDRDDRRDPVSIDPWLALVTLLPLPVIAWMIHLVRDRLRTGFEKVDRIWAR
jgi:ATP-binding cassette subfamily B protein